MLLFLFVLLYHLWIDFLCYNKLMFLFAIKSHWLHWNFKPTWIDLTCFDKAAFEGALYSHWLQGNLIPLWIDFMCIDKAIFKVALYSHWLDLHELILNVSTDGPFQLHYIDTIISGPVCLNLILGWLPHSQTSSSSSFIYLQCVSESVCPSLKFVC